MRFCKGYCSRIKVNKPRSGGWYAKGRVKMCSTCQVLMAVSEFFCPCCGSRLRSHTRRIDKDVERIK